MKDCAEYECSFLTARELTIHSKSLQQAIFIFSIYQISEKQFFGISLAMHCLATWGPSLESPAG